jgi:hypothetical protein
MPECYYNLAAGLFGLGGTASTTRLDVGGRDTNLAVESSSSWLNPNDIQNLIASFKYPDSR